MYRYASASAFWSFVQCQNANLLAIGEPSLAEKCIGQLGDSIPPETGDRVRGCYNGREGKDRLRESVENSWTEGVTKSCTIWIDDRPRCIHDGGVWYDCPGGGSDVIVEHACMMTRMAILFSL